MTKKVDNATGDEFNYEYDSIGRLIHSSATKGNQTTLLTEHMYDCQNRIKKQAYQLLGSDGKYTTYAAEYKYRGSDGALSYVDGLDNCFGDYAFEYDDIARLSSRFNYYFRQDYTYRNISSTQTTNQIATISYAKRDGGQSFSPFSLSYTYDEVGNIKTITGSQITGQNAEYTYDNQGQLTTAKVNGKNYSYTYDTYGNIRKAVEDGVTHTYTYGNANWKDLLTAYDGQTITYDASGNPTSYFNGTRWNFTWQRGRRLASTTGGGKTVTYTYDLAGIR